MNNDENIIYQARLHWIIFIWPAVFFLISLVMLVYLPDFHKIFWLFLGFSAIWLMAIWFNYYFTSLAIKKDRVVIRTGFFVRYTSDVPLIKIESMDIRQSILGSILGYGTFVIIGTGGSKYIIG